MSDSNRKDENKVQNRQEPPRGNTRTGREIPRDNTGTGRESLRVNLKTGREIPRGSIRGNMGIPGMGTDSHIRAIMDSSPEDL